MNLQKAERKDAETVFRITRETIRAIYPHYYPQGAVDFFLAYHNIEHIQEDIDAGKVFLYMDAQNVPVGTVTINDKEIGRLFVLPAAQGNGYGRMLMDFAEAEIFRSSDEIILDASLCAKPIYLKRGYVDFAYEAIPTDNGDFLCHDTMRKRKNQA